MKLTALKDRLNEALWLIVALATFAIAFGLGSSNGPAAVYIIAALSTALLGGCVYRLRNGDSARQRPDGVLIMAAGQLICAVSLLLGGIEAELVHTFVAFAAAIGAIRVVVFRTGSRAKITEREIAILSSGIAVGYYVLVLAPDMGGLTAAFTGVVGIAGLSLGIFATLTLIWLASIDTETVSLPYVLLLIPQVMLVLLLGDPSGALSSDFGRLLVLGVSTLPLSAYFHPKTPNLFTITPAAHSQVSASRSLSSLATILVGPIMVGLDQFTSLELSLSTITVASSLLSIMVAAHLLLLVRRWAAVEHEGQHDSLTGLPNRPLFFSRLDAVIEGATLRDAKFVVMFLDLDRFKTVNDSLGHEKGDLLLRLVSERLRETANRIGKNVTVARLGGDEFAILVPEIRDDRHSHAVGRMFLDKFQESFDMGLRDIYVTPSIGIASFPRDGATVEQLIENADTAMFEAKDRGRNTVVNYQPEHRTPGVHRLEIEAALHKALENGELKLHYQPQIDIKTGQIFAVEALLRWEHPTLGSISPEKFIPVLEESTLIDAIGQWTVESACHTAVGWGQQGLPEINVAVNLSPRQFQKSEVLIDYVARALQNSGLDPRRLELELTESVALERPEEVNATLVHFRQMGIRTAIDDFGVGHTGLDYLDKIEVDTLKIDRSFIDRIGETGAPLVTAVISLARGLDLDVIAEGVETREQVNFLKSRGCRYMQGFLFSRPLSEEQLEHVLRNQMNRNDNYAPQNRAA